MTMVYWNHNFSKKLKLRKKVKTAKQSQTAVTSNGDTTYKELFDKMRGLAIARVAHHLWWVSDDMKQNNLQGIL